MVWYGMNDIHVRVLSFRVEACFVFGYSLSMPGL